MENIKQRLKDTADHCYKCYDAWEDDKKDLKKGEALSDAVHELRKVASRLEIELAVSERDQMKQKPIPIPPHRDAQKKGRQNQGSGSNDKNKGQRKSGGGRKASGKKGN